MDFSHWNMAADFSINEVACLASGIEPVENSANPRVLAITRLLLNAYMSCRVSCSEVLQQNLQDRLAGQEQSYPGFMADAFEEPGELPSIDLRHSFGEALQQPDSKRLIPAKDDSMRFARGDLEIFFRECHFQPDVPFYNQMPKFLSPAGEPGTATDEKQGEIVLAPVEKKSAPADLATRERNTYLCIMAALCKEAKLDYKKPAKTAGLICDMASRMGISLGESTIEGYLKKIPDALESRMK
jgi:hypothetical protein